MSTIHTSALRRPRNLLWGAILFLFCILLHDPSIAFAGIQAGLSLCAGTLIPSLFPFLVLTQLFIKSELASALGRFLARPIRHLFGLSGSCGTALLMGAISGYPVGASCTVELYQRGLCTREDAARLLAISNNAGPAFLIGGIGSVMWKDIRVGILLYVAQLLASVIVGITLHPRDHQITSSTVQRPQAQTHLRFTDLVDAIPKAVHAMLLVCGTVLFFEVLLSALLTTIPLLADHPLARCLLANLIEVSAGATAAASLFGWQAPAIGIGMTGLAIGWSGLSVACQVAAIAEEAEIPLTSYLGGKLLQGILTAGFSFAGALWLL